VRLKELNLFYQRRLKADLTHGYRSLHMKNPSSKTVFKPADKDIITHNDCKLDLENLTSKLRQVRDNTENEIL